MVIPSGIYTDLGATGLRTLLFEKTQITGLFGFENQKAIFEGVHRSFKFIVLTLSKGQQTDRFPAAFMRHEVTELQQFPQSGALWLTTTLIRKLSPDSQSVMEFKSGTDIAIAEKMLKFPLLGEKLEGVWNLALTREFDMTNDSHLFKTENAPGRLPLYEGKMIHQFTHRWGEPKYWIDESEGRQALFGKQADKGQKLNYQDYRVVHRRIASNTNERSLIACIVPPGSFCADTAQTLKNILPHDVSLFITAIFNSFIADFEMRNRITAHLDMHFMYALRVPRLTTENPEFKPIVMRAAQLICTTPEFDELAKEVGLTFTPLNPPLVRGEAREKQLRAELDARIAHLYELTEAEFQHILTTFPLIKDDVKTATLAEYQKLIET